jgi:uncharacterized membrane protein
MEGTWERGVDLSAHAPPFEKNPSSWRQRVPIAVLAGVGVLISCYLALFQWGLVDSVWDPVFGKGSERVLTSKAAKSMDKWLHVPDAAFGAWGYLSEVIFTLVGGTRRWQHRPWMVVLFGIDVIPLGIVSAVLVVTQGLTVGSWCFLCLVTAGISFTLVFFAYDEVWSCLKYLRRVWKHTHDKKLLWNTFIGRASPVADALALQRE